MTTSTHKAEVVPVTLEPHENADALSIVRVWGYTVVVKTSDWTGVEKAVYCVPDSMLPNTEPFAWLFEKNTRYDINDQGQAVKNKTDGAYVRITAIKLRGIYSHGLLIPAPEGAKIGDDLADQLGIRRYEPVVLAGGEDDTRPPAGICPVYDVDSLRRYPHVFRQGEHVVVSEKINGENGRWTFQNGQMHAGSHTRWKKQDPTNTWWRALTAHPEIEAFLRDYPNLIVYGEVYGHVGGWDYGVPPGEVRIAIFDIFDACVDMGWVPHHQALHLMREYKLPQVPRVSDMLPYQFEELERLAEGQTLTGGDHIREGIVVKPLVERCHEEIGRVQLKLVSNAYLENKKRKKRGAPPPPHSHQPPLSA
jgi:RNA ligase (TIGR02306 family)